MAAESAALAVEQGGGQVRRWQQQDGEHLAGWSALGSEQQQVQLAAQQQVQLAAEESGSATRTTARNHDCATSGGVKRSVRQLEGEVLLSFY